MNTRQELSAKLFTEAENTRGFTENKVWGIKQEIVGKIDAGFWNFYYEMNKSLRKQLGRQFLPSIQRLI